MLMICVDVNKPLASKLDALQEEMSSTVTLLEQKVKLLETENNVKEDKIETLTSIVVSMQKNLNAVDGNYRSCCVIVTGVSEDNITSLRTNENAQPDTLSTDHDKVKVLLKL